MSSSEMKARPTILVIEDEPGLLEILAVNLESSGYRAVTAADGIEAWRRFEEEQPDLILLDLNLPRMDGREVLHEIKSDDAFKRIPVVILTTSKDEEDVLRSYNLHANCYITKPIDLGQFLKVVRSIEDFWLSIVVLPPNGAIKCQPV